MGYRLSVISCQLSVISYRLILFSFFLVSCISDKPEIIAPQPVTLVDTGGVYITNEGNFQFGNAAVSYFNTLDSSFAENIFKTVNNRPLGDVCQSMCFFNKKAYIVVNNSGKIEVVDAKTFTSTGTIKGLTSPRYFLPVSNAKAYVTDLYSNSIAVINLNTLSKTGSITCPGWTEELLIAHNKAYITNVQRDKLYIVNIATDVLEDSIAIGYGAASICADKFGKLWVLCIGDNAKKIPASLYKIEPLTKAVEQTFSFAATAATSRLRINGSNDTLYFLNNGVMQLPIAAQSLPTTPLIAASGRNLYGLGINPATSDIYVSDAVDYVQKGLVLVYTSQGKLLRSFKAGIIPGDFYFTN